MARDYKSYSNSSRKKGSSKKNSHWRLWVILIILILAVGYGLYSLKMRHAKTPATSKVTQKIVAPKTPEEQPIKFEFYNLLPKEQVIVNDDSSKTSPPPPPTKPAATKPTIVNAATPQAGSVQNGYLLQIISVKNFPDADKIKARLLLDGFPAQVRSSIVNDVTWYRVEVGPYASMQDATDSQKKLHDKKFNAIVKKYNP